MDFKYKNELVYNKIALVTGGTSGVGLSIVKSLVKENYIVHFIGTNDRAGRKIEKKLNKNKQKAIYINLDLRNIKEVNLFVKKFISQNRSLDLLANIAGTFSLKRVITNDGFEKTFTVGYLSTYIISNGLIDILKNAEHSRIINVSASPSIVLKQKLDFTDLNFSNNYNGFRAMIRTVHAKTVLTQIMSEQLASQSITVNSFHPGIVKSKLTRNMPFFIKLLTKIVLPFMAKKTISGNYISSSSDVIGVTGKLFIHKKALDLEFDSKYRTDLLNATKALLEKIE